MMKLGQFERADLLDIEQDSYVYNLFLLGFVSNVESYFRSVIRSAILIDPICYKACLEQQLTYAAAVHHERELLPEALLENCTFISLSNIAKTINSYLGISMQGKDAEVLALTKEIELFEQLCELRNCIVHRAGLMGSKNAIKLGIDHHKNYFEKPIVLNTAFLQESSVVCLNAVKGFNNFLFNTLVRRIEKETDTFIWDYRVDKKHFEKYFDLFFSESLSKESEARGEKLYSAKSAYDEFRSGFINKGRN